MQNYFDLLTIIASKYASIQHVKLLGVTLIVLGFGLRYWIKRRRFNRRNFVGVEGFKSFEHMNIIRLAELLGMLVGGVILIAGALFIILAFM